MDEIAKRVANLSSTKRALLELRLRKQAATFSAARSQQQFFWDKVTQRVANLSPAKRALLELRLNRKIVAGSATPPSLSLEAITRRVKSLSPAKRTLLELRLTQKLAKTGKTEPARRFTLDDVVKRVANLSPAKRALFELKLQKKFETASNQGIEPEAEPPPPLISLPPAERFPTPPQEKAPIEAPDETPDWLVDIVSAAPPPAKENFWEGIEDAEPQEATAALSNKAALSLDILDFEKEPEAPDWLADIADTIILPPSTVDAGAIGEPIETAPLPAAQAESPPAEVKTSRTEAPRPETKPALEEKLPKAAEVTGMLAGVSTLLPAEKVAVPTLDTESINQAAQDFYAIATETPQPATLPAPLTRQQQLIKGAIWAGLYLLFVALIALPLAAQKLNAGQTAPWSEPASGNAAGVLDSQRRQLISEQLGIIDLQQPGSAALVSFDYTTATQGEMQPLAEAVVNRLLGQGMRIIAVSLEPEGAAIAQQTLENLAAERGDEYGEQVINLGYLPGRAAAVRNLAANSAALFAIPDFQTGQPLKDQPTWSDIQSLAQVEVVVTLADTPATARWWIEQLQIAPQPNNSNRFLLAATSAAAEPFLRPYRQSQQLDGLIAGVNGAAAIEAGRNNFGPARQMVDSLGIATIIVVILIAAGTIVGWMPTQPPETGSSLPAKKDSASPNSQK